MNDNKSRFNQKQILIVIALVVFLVVIIGAVFGNSKYKIPQLIKEGNRYMEEKQFERAISSYEEALSIDKNNSVAIEGEIKVYLAWKEELVSAGDVDTAIQILRSGVDKTQSEKLREALDELEILTAIEDFKDQLEKFSKEAAELCAKEDYTGAGKLLADNKGMLMAIEDTKSDRYICKETGGTPIGIYKMGDNNFFYYGDYDGDKREGEGIWIESCDGDYYSFAKGEWKNDEPSGQQRRENYNGDRCTLSKEGNMKNGLWDGEVNWEYPDGWVVPVKYENGLPIPVAEKVVDGEKMLQISQGEGLNVPVDFGPDGLPGYSD